MAAVGVIGELLITTGVLVLLFLVWQLWLNDIVVGGQQNKQATTLSQTWSKGDAVPPARPTRPTPPEPVVGVAPGYGVPFATLIVPRFGADYRRSIGEGVGAEDVLHMGVGHYPGTQMPGAVGNVALAAHRTTWGASFDNLPDLQVGDSIYIETEAGWYRYVFRSLEYVPATGVGVLDAVPQNPTANPTDRFLTMTTCSPRFTAEERVAAYSVFDTWYPRAGGPPPEIAALVQASAAG